jgi:hypothetical protein
MYEREPSPDWNTRQGNSRLIWKVVPFVLIGVVLLTAMALWPASAEERLDALWEPHHGVGFEVCMPIYDTDYTHVLPGEVCGHAVSNSIDEHTLSVDYHFNSVLSSEGIKAQVNLNGETRTLRHDRMFTHRLMGIPCYHVKRSLQRLKLIEYIDQQTHLRDLRILARARSQDGELFYEDSMPLMECVGARSYLENGDYHKVIKTLTYD